MSGLKHIPISRGLSLPLDAVARTFGILAQRGAGKSNAAVVMAEGMFDAGLHWVAIDPKGDWWGIRSSRDGKGSGLPVVIFGGAHADVPLEPTGGALLADLVVDEHLTCVLDVSEFTEGEKIRFLAGDSSRREEGFAGRLFRRKNGNQDPTHLFLEEAHDYIPQQPFRDQKLLVHVFGKLVTMGRTKGLGATLISQRSARVHKDVLTQVDTLIVLRTTSPQDRKAIAGWLEYHEAAADILASLSGLSDGEAWVWSPEWLKGLTKKIVFNRRKTFDSGATPVQGRAKRRPATLADVDLAKIATQMAATIERAKAEDPRELKKQISQLKRENANLMKQPAPEIKTEVVEVPVFDPEVVEKLNRLFAGIESGILSLRDELTTALHAAVKHDEAAKARPRGSTGVSRAPVPPPVRQSVPTTQSTGESISGSQQRILNALAWLESLNLSPADKTQVALLADQSPTSGGYFNNLGKLRTAGLIEYPAPKRVGLTGEGRALAEVANVPQTSEALHEQIYDRLSGSQVRILRVLIACYPDMMAKDDLAVEAEQSPTSGGYFNNLGRLRSLGLVGYPERGHAAAESLLFLNGR